MNRTNARQCLERILAARHINDVSDNPTVTSLFQDPIQRRDKAEFKRRYDQTWKFCATRRIFYKGIEDVLAVSDQAEALSKDPNKPTKWIHAANLGYGSMIASFAAAATYFGMGMARSPDVWIPAVVFAALTVTAYASSVIRDRQERIDAVREYALKLGAVSTEARLHECTKGYVQIGDYMGLLRGFKDAAESAKNLKLASSLEKEVTMLQPEASCCGAAITVVSKNIPRGIIRSCPTLNLYEVMSSLDVFSKKPQQIQEMMKETDKNLIDSYEAYVQQVRVRSQPEPGAVDWSGLDGWLKPRGD